MENEPTKAVVYLPTPVNIWERLRNHGEKPETLGSLIALYNTDRDCFFDLASIGVPGEAPPWARKLAILANRVRTVVRHGFQVVTSNNGHVKIVSGRESLKVPKAESDSVITFLHTLNGTSVGREAVDYVGTEVSEAELRFKLDSEAQQEAIRNRVETWMSAEPLVLKLDEQDRQAVEGGMPGYVLHGLRRCAAKVVQNPTAVFEGIRLEGKLKGGFAYCGLPKHAYDNAGGVQAAPSKMVYVVYTDADNYIFDWDWVKEDPERSGYPTGWKKRFGKRLERHPEAVLAGVDELKPSEFQRESAWYSVRGDCLFWYALDDLAYADRVNEELTVFRTFDSQRVVGCKLKNVSRIAHELRKEMAALIATRTARFNSILANSLVRQARRGAPKRDYSAYKDVFEYLDRDPVVRIPFNILGFVPDTDSELVTS